MQLISADEVSKHNSLNDCWVIIHGKVYDLTDFLDKHPGGVKVISRWAGQDATAAFDPIHPLDIIAQNLPESVCLGSIDQSTVKESKVQDLKPRNDLPVLSEMLNLMDFESVACKVLTKEAWAYYSSGADDEITLRENRVAFTRFWLKPRVMRNVTHIDCSTRILGYPSSLPVYITATALGKLGHPEGEVVLTRAAGKRQVIQMIPTLASCSLDQMTAARVSPDQVQFFQLYVNGNRDVTERLVRCAEERGCKVLAITVDAPQLGKRERDMRVKFVDDKPDVQEEEQVERNQGAARAISSFIDPGLCWDDLKWFRSITSLPIVLKGIQCAEDALLAAQHGCEGIILSNHGGRQLDTARSAIEILPEVMQALKAANIHHKMQVLVDGGIRRGSDIFKAIALGATAVGVGRPFLYAMAGYGEKGVVRALDILHDELRVTMRLMGVCSLSQALPEMVIPGQRVSVVPADSLSDNVYTPLTFPQSKM